MVFFSYSLFGRVIHQCYQIVTLSFFRWEVWEQTLHDIVDKLFTELLSAHPYSHSLQSNTTLYTCKFRKLVRQEVKTLEQSRQACEKHGSIHINVLLYMEARELKFLYLYERKLARPQAELVY